MDLTLDKETSAVPHTHAETSSSFMIQPLTAARYNALRRESMKNGEVDTILMNSKIAKEVIVSWSSNIKAEISDENLLAFGRKYAFTIMPGITDKALEAGAGLIEEIAEAKKD